MTQKNLSTASTPSGNTVDGRAKLIAQGKLSRASGQSEENAPEHSEESARGFGYLMYDAATKGNVFTSVLGVIAIAAGIVASTTTPLGAALMVAGVSAVVTAIPSIVFTVRYFFKNPIEDSMAVDSLTTNKRLMAKALGLTLSSLIPFLSGLNAGHNVYENNIETEQKNALREAVFGSAQKIPSSDSVTVNNQRLAVAFDQARTTMTLQKRTSSITSAPKLTP